MIEEKLAKAWADRCGIDPEDERVTEADKYGWPVDFGYFRDGWNAKESDAIEILKELVNAYESMPDGQLGRGLTNGPFLKAKSLLGI